MLSTGRRPRVECLNTPVSGTEAGRRPTANCLLPSSPSRRLRCQRLRSPSADRDPLPAGSFEEGR